MCPRIYSFCFRFSENTCASDIQCKHSQKQLHPCINGNDTQSMSSVSFLKLIFHGVTIKF